MAAAPLSLLICSQTCTHLALSLYLPGPVLVRPLAALRSVTSTRDSVAVRTTWRASAATGDKLTLTCQQVNKALMNQASPGVPFWFLSAGSV